MGPLDKIHFQEAGTLSAGSQADSAGSQSEKKAFSGSPLHQLFDLDIEDALPIQALDLSLELESKMPSFWSRIFGWWYQPELKMQNSVPPASQVDLFEVDEVEPISPVPMIDEPDSMPADLAAAKLPQELKRTKLKENLLQKELVEVLASMSEQTIEQIMFIVLKAQIELEKETANVEEETFSKYQEFKKIYEKSLQDIKKALADDEKVASKFNKAQICAFAVSFVCGLISAAVTAGLLTPAGVPLVAYCSTLAPFANAGFTLTTCSKAYFDRRLKEDQAKHEEINHQDQSYTTRVEDSRERLISTADADNAFKERWINLLKRLNKMSSLVLQK